MPRWIKITAPRLAALAFLFAASASAEPPAIIDTHAHIANDARARGGPNFRAALNGAIGRIDGAGIRRLIVMPPPMISGGANYEIESYRFAKEAYAGRILPGGGGGSLNGMIHSGAPDSVTDDRKRAFRARAEEIVAAGAVVFGEIALHHMSLSPMGPNHPYESTPADHPLMLLLADIAAEKNLPIDVHLDAVPEDMSLPGRPVFNRGNPATLRENLAAFERLLARNRGARIVWAHAGSDPLGARTVQVQRGLLTRHPNLFMSLRLNAGGPPAVAALDDDRRLKPFWLALLEEFPDRFVVGSDFFHSPAGSAGRGPAEESLGNYRAALAQMPAGLAEAIAHRNAERIYRIGD